MNIEMMKKLEDLKGVLRSINLKINEKVKAKKSQYIQSVRNDFADFFKEKGFKVNVEDLCVKAAYGNLTASLSHSEPETDFFGCYFSFHLNLKALNNKEYSIMLSRGAPSISVKVSSPTRSKDDELQKEFEAVQHSIDEAQNRLDNFSQEEWKLFIKNDAASHGSLVGKGFNSMRELLSSLME